MLCRFASDLTGEMAPDDNRLVPAEEAPVKIESNVPAGWLPEGAAVRAIARRYPDGHWEAVVPDFSIAGMGPSPEQALVNALELLDEYLCLAARDGKVFEETVRPISRRSMFAMIREALGLLVSAKFDRLDRDRPSQHYRVPLRPQGAH